MIEERRVFLDLDGVVLPFGDDLSGPVQGRECAAWINRLVAETGAKVVISSSWRTEVMLRGGYDWRVGHDTDMWRKRQAQLADLVGLDVEVVGFTPSMSSETPWDVIPGERGAEIQAWLAEHPEVTGWVAIDDFPEWLGPEVLRRAVVTEPCVGMSEAGYLRGLALFAEQSAARA